MKITCCYNFQFFIEASKIYLKVAFIILGEFSVKKFFALIN